MERCTLVDNRAKRSFKRSVGVLCCLGGKGAKGKDVDVVVVVETLGAGGRAGENDTGVGAGG